MRYYFDAAEFSKRIKTKRVIELDKGLREVAKKTGVSFSTLSRMENKKIPEMDSFLKVCNWLDALPREFLTTTVPAKEKISTKIQKQKSK